MSSSKCEKMDVVKFGMDLELSTLAAEFLGPFGVSLQVFLTDGWSGVTNRLDEVFQDERGFQELVGFYGGP